MKSEARAPEIRLEGITKLFGRARANDAVDLTLRPATIHALVGENGAGKSTLMRVLYGLLRADAGRILIDGVPTEISSPAQALAHGIGMIHQHFMLVPAMTVLENIALGAPGLRGLAAFPPAGLAARLHALFEEYGFELDPHARIESLGVGGRQRVEIARMLYRGARVLICDEPTAVLAPPEVASFFRILRRFRAEGRTVVFITHKLAEVVELADRVTVLRHGRAVGEAAGAQIEREHIVRLIMGGNAAPSAAPAGLPVPTAGDALLAAEDLTVRAADGPAQIERATLALRAGEILGIAGVTGNGQQELAEVLSGRRAFAAGRLKLRGVTYRPGDPIGVGRRPALIPEDRNREGLIGSLRLWENLLLGRTNDAPFMRTLWYAHGAARAWSRPHLEHFRVEPLRPDARASALSGGNQQKLLCAREITRGGDLLIACQPTRGIDLASTHFIHGKLREFRARGGGLLLISADLDEILSLSDRVAVIYRGRLGPLRPRADLDLAQIGREMVGLAREGAEA